MSVCLAMWVQCDNMGSDYNNCARLTNSSLATSAEAQLVPLRTSRNEDVEDFPATQGDIDRLSCWSPPLALLVVVNMSIV